MALSVTFNHAQNRLVRDRVPLLARGAEMEPNILRSGAFVEPVNKRILLEPYALTPTWKTSNSGNYAKLALASFTTSGSGWETRTQTGLTAGPWLALKDTAVNGTLITTATYTKNRGFYVAFHQYSKTGDEVVFRCGWNSSASLSAGVGIEVKADNSVDVYKGGTIVGSGKISGSKTTGTKPGELTAILLIPHAHRELLIYSPTTGDAFSQLFSDIDDDAANPTITPATKFWIEVPTGGTQVQAAPLVFPSTGYVTSVEQSFLLPPEATDALEVYPNPSWNGGGTTDYIIYGHPAYVGTSGMSAEAVDWTGAAFTANGSNTEARLKITLTTSDTTVTPTGYGAALAYEGIIDATDSSEAFDATDYVTRATLSVPDDPGGVTWDFELREPDALEADIPNLKRAINMPVQVKVGTIILTDGRSGTPEWHRKATDGASRVMIDVRDGFKALETFATAEPIPFDGFNLSNNYSFFMGIAGVLSNTISTTTFTLPGSTSGEADGWASLMEPGDAYYDHLREQMDDYAPAWIYGIRPTLASDPEGFILSPTDMGTTAATTLYRSDADAVSIGTKTGLDIGRFIYRVSQIETLEPEATEVRVTGYERITLRGLQAYKVDSAAEDFSTAPSSRPSNWVGEKRRYGLEKTAITTQSLCNEVTTTLYDRLTVTREMVEWKGHFLYADSDGRPLWRGDNVRLHGLGTYRIISFGGDFIAQDGTVNFTDFTYVGEKVADEP